MAALRLGVTDQGKKPRTPADFFAFYHESSNMQDNFRGEKNGRWRGFNEQPGQAVKEMQSQLRELGFMPHGDLSGIFDYRTQSAARLFQEYVRSAENKTSIGVPDAIIGPKTRQHLKRWANKGIKADWINASAANPSPEYENWMQLLKKLKAHYQPAPSFILEKVHSFDSVSDTRKVAEWDFSPEHIHLIGIRRGAGVARRVNINNDVFKLLVNGLVFTFFGSTDPKPQGGRHLRSPFLLNGQHRYRFGWHKLSNPVKVYRAFRPARHGVLIIRDVPGSDKDALDVADLKRGTVQNNLTINIHWSGKHTSNWSAGCQVISGGGYINHKNELIDCWDIAAPSYPQLPKLTRAAYNVMLDLVTVFSRDTRITGGDLLHYTLIDEKDLVLEPTLGPLIAVEDLKRGLQILAKHNRQQFKKYKTMLA